jgi:hypothetical protein
MLLRITWFILALTVLASARAQEERSIRVGLLRFGTVAWEIDTIRHHGGDVTLTEYRRWAAHQGQLLHSPSR